MTRCPAGHPIDPSWKSCPYCDRQALGGDASAPSRSTRLEPALSEASSGPQRTRLEEGGPEGARRTRLEGETSWPEPIGPAPTGSRPTRLEEPEPSARGRRTVLQESVPAPSSSAVAPAPAPAEGRAPEASMAPGASASVRRLLAVLAAPDLGPGGTVFPIRGGKNSIGAGQSNDIVLTGDSEISNDHAVILHRSGTFHLTDRLSTNGTWVNGLEVPANGTLPLHDRDRIRCGRTELVFLVIEPVETSPVA